MTWIAEKKKDDGKEGGSQRGATSRLTLEDHLHANCVSAVRKYEGHMFYEHA